MQPPTPAWTFKGTWKPHLEEVPWLKFGGYLEDHPRTCLGVVIPRSSSLFGSPIFPNGILRVPQLPPPLGCSRKLGSMVRINGLFHLLINGVYCGYNPLILTFNPNLQRDILLYSPENERTSPENQWMGSTFLSIAYPLHLVIIQRLIDALDSRNELLQVIPAKILFYFLQGGPPTSYKWSYNPYK